MPKARATKRAAKRSTKSASKSGPRTFAGKKVVDATKPLSFVVTNQECKRGKPNDPCECAAALAIKRSHPGAIIAHVHRSFSFVELPDKVIRYKTSGGLRDQTIRYDASKKFDPGAYTLGAVPASVIASRGKQHSPPDRPRGDPNSPKRRQKAVALRHHVGRQAFHFNATNSDYRAGA
jgi:hypothetical protein